MKGISALVMLSEGTLLSGGERDRKIIAWDTLQNYKKITETKVGSVHLSLLPCLCSRIGKLGKGHRSESAATCQERPSKCDTHTHTHTPITISHELCNLQKKICNLWSFPGVHNVQEGLVPISAGRAASVLRVTICSKWMWK